MYHHYCLHCRVSEDIGQFNLTVLRSRGVFGEVSVLYGVININTNAMGLPTDYITMTSGVNSLYLYYSSVARTFCGIDISVWRWCNGTSNPYQNWAR